MKTRKIPISACRMLAAVTGFGDNGAGAKTAPFRMVARSSEPVNPMWCECGIVHDMSGMKVNKNRLSIDYNHDEIIGYCNRWDTSTGELVANGVIHSVIDGDRAQEVILRGQGDPANGIETAAPTRRPITYSDPLIEEIPEGFTTTVNGRSFNGPLYVIREWAASWYRCCSVWHG